MSTPLIRLRGVTKTYERGGEVLTVLNKLDLDIEKNGFYALMGPSGSGKTTLLNLIGGLDQGESGEIVVNGEDIARMDGADLATWRASHVGFVFQGFNLIPVLTAQENVELPLLLTNLSRSERRKHAEVALALVGLSDRRSHRPSQLSGGQEQRVAIARAIVTDPMLIMADEPTGDLDRKSAGEVLDLLTKLNEAHGKTILMVTHDPAAASRAKKIVNMDKGRLGDVVDNQPVAQR
ncbi:MAG: ABC transporter ATP-binding protein [Planctomycetes bacterium]|nr:ABC transporter ATP-binding protein [Planctomycetota bacterium]